MGAMSLETLAFWGGGSGLEMHTREGLLVTRDV